MVNCTEVVEGEKRIFTRNIHWFLIPAVLIVVILAFCEKRRSFKKETCGGRPGLVSPMNFIDGYQNRWGLSFVLGTLTSLVISLTLKTLVTTQFPLWAKIFIVYLQGLEASVITFPLFACITTKYRLVGSVLGLLYSVGCDILLHRLSYDIFVIVQTARCYSPNEKIIVFSRSTFYILDEVPVPFCCLLLVGKFVLRLIQCIKMGVMEHPGQDDPVQHHRTYVRQLFARFRTQQTHPNKLRTIIKEWIKYSFRTHIPGFHFPVHVFCTAFIAVITLYTIQIKGLGIVHNYSKFVIFYLLDDSYENFFKIANIIGFFVSCILGMVNIYCHLSVYKRDILRLNKGDRSFMPESFQTTPPQHYMARRTTYVGCQLVCIIYGTLVNYFLVSIPTAAVLSIFHFLQKKGKTMEILELWQWIIYPISAAILFRVQMLIIEKCLLQEKLKETDTKKPMAVKNRPVFNILSFFMVFVSASVGIFSVFKRLVIALIIGVFLTPRMDKSICTKGYERMDTPHMVYIGLLMVDHMHNNPIMRVFCAILSNSTPNGGMSGKKGYKPLTNPESDISKSDRQKRGSRACQRWSLAYTLVRNPRLRCYRKHLIKPVQTLSDVQHTRNVLWEVRAKLPKNLAINVAALFVFLLTAFLFVEVLALKLDTAIPVP